MAGGGLEGEAHGGDPDPGARRDVVDIDAGVVLEIVHGVDPAAAAQERDGTLVVADDADSAAALRRVFRFQQEQGLEVEWLSSPERIEKLAKELKLVSPEAGQTIVIERVTPAAPPDRSVIAAR